MCVRNVYFKTQHCTFNLHNKRDHKLNTLSITQHSITSWVVIHIRTHSHLLGCAWLMHASLSPPSPPGPGSRQLPRAAPD